MFGLGVFEILIIAAVPLTALVIGLVLFVALRNGTQPSDTHFGQGKMLKK